MPDPTPDAPVEPVVEPDPPAADPPAEDPPADLGDAGKRALDAERTARKEAERLAREATAELDRLRLEQLPDNERLIAEARDEARSEALASVNSRLLAAELRAATAGRLADPSLLADPEVAVRLLGLSEVPVTDTGDIDSEAISDAVASFLEAKPYLAVSATQPAGNADQGARRSPQSKDLQTQIREAEAAGDWQLAGQLKLHKLAAVPRP